MFTNKEIKNILNYARKDELDLLLCISNLREREFNFIKLVDIDGNTEEEVANLEFCCRNTVQNTRRKAYKKLKIAWHDNKLALIILKKIEMMDKK